MIAAPSGAGKTSLVRALMAREPALRFSISYTTRKQRANEVHGRDYFFVVKPTSSSAWSRPGEFLEHARVFDNYYGTSRRQVEQCSTAGQDVMLEIDWQGAQQIRARDARMPSRSSSCRRRARRWNAACASAARTPSR